MDQNLVYAKTPAGEEATLQRTRVVQRNLRMVLLQVDGQLNVAGLVAKIGNESLVFNALRELEKGGFVALAMDAPSVWEQSKQRIKSIKKAASGPVSEISTFGASKELPAGHSVADSNFSTFGKPVLPALETRSRKPSSSDTAFKSSPRYTGPSLGERFSGWLASLKNRPGADLSPLREVSWSKRIAFGVVALILGCSIVVLLFPYDSYRPNFESAMTEAFEAPVRIGRVEIEFLPQPILALRDVRIGSKEELRIGVVQIPRLLAFSHSGRKEIGSVALSGVTMMLDFAGGLTQLRNGMRNSQQFSLERIDLKGVTLVTGDLALSNLSGEINFKPGATEGKMSLQTEDSTLKLDMTPSVGGALLNVEGIAWKPAEGSPFNFSSISAKGLLQPGKLILQNFDLSVWDGSVSGSMLLDWSNGFSIAGDAALARLSVSKLSSAFGASLAMEGQMSGNLHWRASATSWPMLFDALESNLAFKIDHGVMTGIDLGEAIRRGVGQSARGGVTKFEHLKGNLLIDSKLVTGSNLEMDAGLVKASGQFTAKRDKTVDANIQVNINSSTQSIRAPILITGTLPTLQTAVIR